MAFGVDDFLTTAGTAVSAGSKVAGGLAGLLNGNPAALPSALINLVPTAMSAAGSMMGGSVGAGLSSLASGIAPAAASALSVYAGPAAVAAYVLSKAITERLNAPKKQGMKQLQEAQEAYRVLPYRVAARTEGADVLNQLGELGSDDALRQALQASHTGIQADLERTPLAKALDVVIQPGRFARSEFPDQAPPVRPELEPLRADLTGPKATDNYVAQILTADAGAQRGMDISPYQTWTSEGTGTAGGQWHEGEFLNAEGEVQTAGPNPNEPWTWDEDFLNNALATIGGAVGIDPGLLPGGIHTSQLEAAEQGITEYDANDPRWHTAAVAATDLPGWDAGNYGQAIGAYLTSLDPSVAESEAWKRYQTLPGLGSLFAA